MLRLLSTQRSLPSPARESFIIGDTASLSSLEISDTLNIDLVSVYFTSPIGMLSSPSSRRIITDKALSMSRRAFALVAFVKNMLRCFFGKSKQLIVRYFLRLRHQRVRSVADRAFICSSPGVGSDSRSRIACKTLKMKKSAFECVHFV